MRAPLLAHGGTLEKYIGDAIMAVFGFPKVREDDALRAVRAAHGMQRALAALNVELEREYGVTLANRTGVNTGPVVANSDPNANQQIVTGDTVNVAARLEQSAPAQEVLIGELTHQPPRDSRLSGGRRGIPRRPGPRRRWRFLGGKGTGLAQVTNAGRPGYPRFLEWMPPVRRW